MRENRAPLQEQRTRHREEHRGALPHHHRAADLLLADPHSPWQRPSNENTNGLLRQYFPKGTDFTRYVLVDLEGVAKTLNERPARRSDSRHQPKR